MKYKPMAQSDLDRIKALSAKMLEIDPNAFLELLEYMKYLEATRTIS